MSTIIILFPDPLWDDSYKKHSLKKKKSDSTTSIFAVFVLYF